MDAALERLWSRLDRDAGLFDTHVVVVADHGESFGEDGSMGHGKRITSGQVHVPLFIVSPRLVPASRQDIAGSIDVAVTLYSLARVGETAPGGRDLTLAAPRGGAFGMRRTYLQPHDDLRLDGKLHRLDFNLFYAVDGDGHLFTGNLQGLRDGASDTPRPQPDVERRLKLLFGAFEKELTGTASGERMDPHTEEALRALGYVG
jgi:hypothetical protein